MSDAGFEERLEQIKEIAEVVGKFENPVLQEAAYHYLVGDGGSTRGNVPTVPARTAPEPTAKADDDGIQDLDIDRKPPAPKPAKKSSTRPGSKKQSFDIDKALNFYKADGGSKKPFKEFVEGHPPKTLLHKVAVAVYWLSREALVAEVSIDQVYTAFKTLGWPIPNDLANTVQQAGTKNYVDSKSRDNITLTTHGENLVEHELLATARP